MPQFYLSRFTGSDGLLWMHDLKLRTARQVTPKDALAEKYLYSPEQGDDPRDDTVERFFAQHVDGPAAAPLAKLASGVSLSSTEREHVAVFLAFQETRVPRARDTVRGWIAEMGDMLLRMKFSRPDYVKRMFAEIGKEISEADLQNIQELVRSGAVKTTATKEPWFHAMMAATRIAYLLHDLPWSVVRAPEGVEFVTSDAPIVKVVTDPTVPEHFHGGWLSPGAESTFALDPSTCLVIKPNGTEQFGDVAEEWCVDVNRRTAHYAYRFLISRQRRVGELAIASAPSRFSDVSPTKGAT